MNESRSPLYRNNNNKKIKYKDLTEKILAIQSERKNQNRVSE